MKGLKKGLTSTCMAFAVMICMMAGKGLPVLAAQEAERPLFHMTNVDPAELAQTYGVGLPTETQSIGAAMYFSGSSKGQVLYTDKKFNGQKDYIVYVHNTSSNPVEVKIKTLTKTYETFTVDGNSEKYIACSTGNVDTKLYLRFDAHNKAYAVDGYVSH